jgi:CspA family cold shock protein
MSHDFMDDSFRQTPLKGRVKWFDPVRGFGFVLVDGLDKDVLLHVNVLRGFGQSSILDGAGITMRLQQSERGLQASEIIEIEPPAAVEEEPSSTAHDPIDETLPYLPARVKWFDRIKGFGFANAFGSREDVFIHSDVLRRFGLADLMPGEAICMRAAEGSRGKLAVEVRRWEHFEG